MLQAFDEGTKLLERSFVFFCKFKEHAGVCYLRFKTFLALNLSFDPAAFLQQLLCSFLIVPKVRCRGLGFDLT